jgi:hypothetical protein
VASGWPVASLKDHQKFCEVEGWTCVSHGTGRRGKGRDHVRYELALPDGRILRTKISHPINRRTNYGIDLWKHILRDQLCVTQQQFWDCVEGSELPER